MHPSQSAPQSFSACGHRPTTQHTWIGHSPPPPPTSGAPHELLSPIYGLNWRTASTSTTSPAQPPMSAVEVGILASSDPIVVPTPTTMSDLVTLCRGCALHLPTHPTVASLTKIIASYNAEVRLGGGLQSQGPSFTLHERAGVASFLCSLRRDLAAFRHVTVLEDTPTLAVHIPYLTAESVSPRPAADISPRASPSIPAVTVSPEGTLSSLELARERLEFEKSQHKNQMDLARRRLDFEERQLVAACGSSTSPTSPLFLSSLLPSTPVSPHPVTDQQCSYRA